jgi:glycosyltransferase involved in cell wall biosynthesis
MTARDAWPTLRVLTFLHSFEPGGVERVALRLHAAWLAAGNEGGVDARLVMGRNDGAMRREWPGLEPDMLGDGRVPTAHWETLWMILRLPAAIRRIQPDVLFCAGNSYTIVAVMMRLLLGKRCPPVVAKISNDLVRADLPAPARPFYRAWLRIQGRMLDRIVGMAPPMRAEIAALMQAPGERIAIIDDPSLDESDIIRLAEARRTAVKAGSGRRFLAIGRLAAQKNFALLIEAFARIAGPDDRLAIIGEGGERRALEAQIKRLGLEDKVRLPGHVSPLDAELTAADALVLSSDYEGVPAVVAEALAAGLPIVATRCSVSMDDMLGGGRFGLLVPVGDVAALASAMIAIAAQNFDANAASTQARRFTVQLASHRYLALMEDLARV